MAKNFEEENQYEVLTHFSARTSARAVARQHSHSTATLAAPWGTVRPITAA